VYSAYPDTYYQVSIQAHNAIGLSDQDTIIVKTARGRSTLIKKKRKFSSFIRKFRWRAIAKSYMRKGFLIYDLATAPFWISLYMRKI
jgi:hypothetical protein